MNKILNKNIKDLELQLLDPKIRKNKKRLNELLSDNFIEIASTGDIFNKQDILKNLPKQNNIAWKVSNIKVQEIFDSTFLITYKVKKIDLKNKLIINSVRSSIWNKEKNNFKMIFHQGTLIK